MWTILLGLVWQVILQCTIHDRRYISLSGDDSTWAISFVFLPRSKTQASHKNKPTHMNGNHSVLKGDLLCIGICSTHSVKKSRIRHCPSTFVWELQLAFFPVSTVQQHIVVESYHSASTIAEKAKRSGGPKSIAGGTNFHHIRAFAVEVANSIFRRSRFQR